MLADRLSENGMLRKDQLTTGRILSNISSETLPFFFSSSADPHFVADKYLSHLSQLPFSLPPSLSLKITLAPKSLSPASPHPRAVGPRLSWAAKRGTSHGTSTPPATRALFYLPARPTELPPVLQLWNRFGQVALCAALHPLEESSVDLNRLRIMCGRARGRGSAAFLRPTTVKEAPTGSQLAASAKRRPTGRLHSKDPRLPTLTHGRSGAH